MVGKASLLFVLGFSTILTIYSVGTLDTALSANDNMVDYFCKNKAHNIATSGANMASNLIFFNKDWDSGFSNVNYDDGILNVDVDTSGIYKVITSIGKFNDISETTQVVLLPSNYAKFGNFYESLSAMPATGDTFRGPFHTNGRLTVYGDPVFWGKTTCKYGLRLYYSGSDPKFYGGFASGIDIPLEYDFSHVEGQATKIYEDPAGRGRIMNVRMYFNADGTVTHSYQINSRSWTTPITESISNLAPNGVVYIKHGNLYTKGTINGKITVMVDKRYYGTAGNIYIEDDIVYNTDPRDDSSSQDLLGLVAENQIEIEYNDDTKNGDDIITHASMFSLNSTIGPDPVFWQDRRKYPYLASWKILGGIIATNTIATASYSNGVPVRGLKMVHHYDERFMTTMPPAFPHTKYFEIVSWYE